MKFGCKRYPKIVRPNLSGKFSLKSPHENRKDNLNAPYLEVIVTDSVYISLLLMTRYYSPCIRMPWNKDMRILKQMGNSI